VRLLAVALLVVGWAAQAATAQPATSRIVHRFDFDEPGYFGEAPRGWVRFPDRDAPDPAFPRYTAGRFDREVGHKAAPSFYLESEGRSVAYRYAGSDTRIRPGEYMVHGWIRPNRLVHAKAALSAYYLDWEGHYIASTQRFSNLVGSGDEEDSWQRVSVVLPSAPQRAHFIGVTCWVVQDEVWRRQDEAHRLMRMRDVRGGAWFDDISVQVQPRAELKVCHPGSVNEYPEPVRLSAIVADEETEGLTADLLIRSRDGALVETHAVDVHTFEDSREAVVVRAGLAPGLYQAELIVRSLGEPIVERSRVFAVLGAWHTGARSGARRLGLELPEASAGCISDVVALITQSGARTVKLPIWTGDPAVPAFDVHPTELHDLLDQLIASRTDVVGVFGGAPTRMVRAGGAFAPALLEVLAQDSRVWRPELDAIVAPYASIFLAWQLGADGDEAFARDARASDALLALREAMREMLPDPNLATTTSAGVWPAGSALPAQELTIALPDDVHAEEIAAHLESFRDARHNRVWLALPGPQVDDYAPEAALAAWTRMLVEGRRTAAACVFTTAPWRLRTTETGVVAEPTAALPILRTVADLLGDAESIATFDVGESATLRAFGDGRQATIVAWDAYANGSRTHELQLGVADHYVDHWGGRHALRRSATGAQQLPIGPAPVFVPGIEQWLVSFQAAFQIAPAQVAFAIEPQPFTLTISNPRGSALAGEVVFDADARWEIEPRHLRFALQPGEQREYPLLIRQPQDENAGIKTLAAHVQLASEPKYQMTLPLRFELGLADVEVWGYAVNDAGSVRIQHGVTNRASTTLSFSAFAELPGRTRQYRTITELLPGQTLTTEYLFRDAPNASGRAIRLGLREVNGPRLHNLEVQVP